MKIVNQSGTCQKNGINGNTNNQGRALALHSQFNSINFHQVTIQFNSTMHCNASKLDCTQQEQFFISHADIEQQILLASMCV